MGRRSQTFAGWLLVVATYCGTAHADGAAAASETARALFNEGLSLRARGDVEGSLAKLRAAYALRATPVTALELARAHVDRRDLVEARTLLLSVKRLPVAADESRDAATARRDASTLAETLKPRIPSLTLKLAGPGALSNPVVSIDGVDIPREAIAEPQRLNPKRHRVVARAVGGREASVDVELREGENASIVIDVPAGEGGAVPAMAAEPPDAHGSTVPKILVYGGFSLAFAGVVVGTFAGVRALDQVSELKSACNEHRICEPARADAIDSAKTSGNVATTAFIVGGVGAVLGAAGLLLWPRAKPSSARASITFDPAAFGVRGTFR